LDGGTSAGCGICLHSVSARLLLPTRLLLALSIANRCMLQLLRKYQVTLQLLVCGACRSMGLKKLPVQDGQGLREFLVAEEAAMHREQSLLNVYIIRPRDIG
jgi:hypothetical protein